MMKQLGKVLTVASLLGFWQTNYAQINMVWADSEVSSVNHLVETSSLTPSGEFLIAGRAIGSPSTWFVNKTSEEGNIGSATNYFPNDFSILNEMIEVSSGGQLLVGHSADFTFAVPQGKVIRNKENGTVLWSRSFVDYQFFSATEVADQHFIISGTADYGAGDVPVLIKLDELGDLIWEKSFPYSSNKLVTKLDGNVGFISSGPTLGVFDTSGTIVFDTTYVFSPSMTPNDLDIDEQDNFVICGIAGNDGAILNTAPDGEIQYYRTYGGSGLDVIRSIRFHFEGGYVAVGSSTSSDGDLPGNLGGSDLWLLVLNDTAGLIRSLNFGGSGNEYGTAIAVDSDADFYTAVSSSSIDGDFAGGGTFNDAWAVKWEFTRPCSPSSTPGDLKVKLNPTGVKLSWRTIEGTEACRVKIASTTDTLNERRFRKFGDYIQEISIPSSKLTLGDLYIWRVECACSITPRIQTPLSVKDTFSFNPRIGNLLVLEDYLIVYPNPVSQTLHITHTNAEMLREKIYITDLNGRLVWTGYAGDLSVEKWPAGLYNVQMGKASKRIIVQ